MRSRGTALPGLHASTISSLGPQQQMSNLHPASNISASYCRLPEAALSEYDYYMDTHHLRISTSNMKNANSRQELERIKTAVLQNLALLPAVPGADFAPAPPALVQVSHLAIHIM